MRKFISLGVGAIATATMAFTAAGPASAAVSPPGSVVGQVCASLPGSLASAVTNLATATLAQTTAVADVPLKLVAFGSAQTNLVNALVDYIQTVDAGGSVGAKALVLSDKVAAYSDKASAWGNSLTALDSANRNFAIAGMSQGIFTSLQSGLGGCI